MFVFTACRERNELLRGGKEGKPLVSLQEQMRDEAVKQEALWRDKKVTVGHQNAFKEGSPATYVSPPFTLKHTGGTASASVELIDCGCKPRITLIN